MDSGRCLMILLIKFLKYKKHFTIRRFCAACLGKSSRPAAQRPRVVELAHRWDGRISGQCQVVINCPQVLLQVVESESGKALK